MAIREVKLFQDAPKIIPVIPLTTTPYSKYNYKEYEPAITSFHPDTMTSEDVPWYYKDEIVKKIHDVSDRTRIYACEACGVIPSVRDRRFVVKSGDTYLACGAECVEIIKKRRK
jgi:hypothetical protein